MITPADARDAVGVDSTHTPVLARLIAGATATLGRELGRYLGPVMRLTEVHCGGPYPGHSRVFLINEAVVDDAHPVVVSTRAGRWSPWADLASDQWTVDGRTLETVGHFPHGRGTIRVQYYAGYDPGTGPDELQELVREMVRLRYAARGTDSLLTSETLGDYSYTRGDVERLEGWQSVVSRWRRRLV